MIRPFRLTNEPGGLGVSCGEEGLSLAGVPLLQKSAGEFSHRPVEELEVLLEVAYGDEADFTHLPVSLFMIAHALNTKDLGRAMVLALRLNLPELDPEAGARIRRMNDALLKYDPSEPRDWRGRWTAGDAGSSASPEDRPRPRLSSMQAAGIRPYRPDPPAAEAGSASSSRDSLTGDTIAPWGGGHLNGGKLIFTADEPNLGIGGNGPPPEAEIIPERELSIDAPRVPKGWDTPAQTIDGLEYPLTRNPTLPDGSFWPEATHDKVQAILAPQPGRAAPSMTIFVPLDGVGPLLIGSTKTLDWALPPGYDPVILIGTPQVTHSQGKPTRHAWDSINEALRLAGTHEFSTIYFNRSFTHITQGEFQSLLRPDVTAVGRPSLDSPFRYFPYESLSNGQTLEERQAAMEHIPGVKRVRGEHYKRFVRFSPEHLKKLGVRRLCS